MCSTYISYLPQHSKEHVVLLLILVTIWKIIIMFYNECWSISSWKGCGKEFLILHMMAEIPLHDFTVNQSIQKYFQYCTAWDLNYQWCAYLPTNPIQKAINTRPKLLQHFSLDRTWKSNSKPSVHVVPIQPRIQHVTNLNSKWQKNWTRKKRIFKG